MIVRYKKNIKKLTEEDVHKIDEELNEKDAFFYKNAHVSLTKNYIVNFGNTFDVISYKDIVWIYPYEIRQRGVKTSQSIQIMTKDGKMHGVASLSTHTKKVREVFEEIYETIVKKSTNALVGYSKENKKLAKEKVNKQTTRKKLQQFLEFIVNLQYSLDRKQVIEMEKRKILGGRLTEN